MVCLDNAKHIIIVIYGVVLVPNPHCLHSKRECRPSPSIKVKQFLLTFPRAGK